MAAAPPLPFGAEAGAAMTRPVWSAAGKRRNLGVIEDRRAAGASVGALRNAERAASSV